MRNSQEFVAKTSNKICRSIGILWPAKITTKPLSPKFGGNLHLQRDILEAIAKQRETTDQAEVICDVEVWVYNDENGRYLTVEIVNDENEIFSVLVGPPRLSRPFARILSRANGILASC